jgi:hypothetical protein
LENETKQQPQGKKFLHQWTNGKLHEQMWEIFSMSGELFVLKNCFEIVSGKQMV